MFVYVSELFMILW